VFLHSNRHLITAFIRNQREMSTGGRAARAASSRQVKQELVRLLYGGKYSKTGPQGHKKLDSASYSHGELKQAYFARLQEIHPDKNKSSKTTVEHDESKLHFHELQQAWDHYEDLAKAMEKVQAEGQRDFTKFGVGCSFSDNEQERALRSEITDQACRGWFSSGLLSAESSTSEADVSTKTHVIRLVDDDLFVEVDSKASSKDPISTEMERKKNGKSRPRTLIPGYKG
jgi:curved DNA-binding protein CbpA